MPDANTTKRLEVAIAATRQAGQKTLQWFRNDDLTVTKKKDHSPVTAADLAAEEILQKELLTSFPDDSFLGEETGSTRGTSGFEWVVDPIDGTKSFIQGVPLFATLVGCRKDGKGVLGVIYIPALDELAYAAVGSGAWYEQRGCERVVHAYPHKLLYVRACSVRVIFEISAGVQLHLMQKRRAKKSVMIWKMPAASFEHGVMGMGIYSLPPDAPRPWRTQCSTPGTLLP